MAEYIRMRCEPFGVPIGLGTPQRQGHVRGTTGLGVGPGLGAKKCSVEDGLGFCGLHPLLRTAWGLGKMLMRVHALPFPLPDSPGGKEHKQGAWGHAFI